MTKLKLTAFSIILFFAFAATTSCHYHRDEIQNLYTRSGLVLSGAQETPANASAATGTLSVSYSKLTSILSYTITWSGLSGNPTGIGLYGLAPRGYMAPPSPLGKYTNGIAQNITGYTAATTGTFSGTVLVDGVTITENDVLNGMFYINIRTAANPYGEIRAQVEF